MFVSFNDESLRSHIDAVCRGYSSRKHWIFFQQLLQLESVHDICMLGVYFGRDIAYMDAIFKQLGKTDYSITGVDKFADVAGADWPAHLRGKTWDQAGFGPAPTKAAALANLERLGAKNVSLVEGPGQDFLASTQSMFDFIYIDTSHDYETTAQCIDLGIPRLRPHGLMGGDDYSNEGTWGVKKAVSERFPRHQVSAGWIWVAQHADYRPSK